MTFTPDRVVESESDRLSGTSIPEWAALACSGFLAAMGLQTQFRTPGPYKDYLKKF